MKNLLLFLAFFLTITTIHAQWDWVKEIPGAANSSNFYGITTDAQGDVYVCGSKNDPSCGFRLAKYKSNGALDYNVFKNISGSICNDYAYDVAVDVAKNKVFVGGSANAKPALVIFDANTGNYASSQLTITCGGVGDITGLDYGAGFLYIIGNYTNGITIGGSSLTGSGAFVAKINGSNNSVSLLKYIQSGAPNSIRGCDVKLTTSGSVCVSFSTHGNVAYQAGGSYTWSGNGIDYVVAKLSASFSQIWGKKFHNTATGGDSHLPLAFTALYSGGVFCAFGMDNAFLDSKLVKFSLGGVQQASQTFPNRCIRDIAMSPCGKVYATGHTFGPVQASADFLPCWQYPTNLFLSRHSFLDCTQEWIEQSSNACAWGEGVTIGVQGNPLVCFNSSGNPPLILGNFTITPVTKAFTALFKDNLNCCVGYNKAMDFDGVNDYIQAANSPLTGNAAFTIEAWFRTNATGSLFRRLTGWGGTNTRFEIGVASGKMAIYYYPGSATFTMGTKIVNDNLWHHVAVTRSGNTTTVFVDGVQDQQKTNVGSLNLGSPFRVGRWPGAAAANQDWKGQVDEVRVWNTVRTLTEINAKRYCKLVGNEAGLKLYYSFEEGVAGGANGNTCQNYATNGPNNGTLFNFTQNGNASNWVCSDLNISTCTPFLEPGDRSDEESTFTQTKLGAVVYPNPAFDQVSVQLEESASAPIYLHMLDLTGKLIKVAQFYPGDIKVEMDIQELPPSIYFLELSDGKGMRETVKVLKQ